MASDNGPRHPEITVELTGIDGNAFSIIGAVSRALRRGLREQGMPRDQVAAEVSDFQSEATSGDYDHLLATAFRWVEVE